jgi:hypothetical protein
MFTKLAALCAFGAGRPPRPAAIVGPYANVRPEWRSLAKSRHARRPALICRWQSGPLGALECHWQAIALHETEETAQRHYRKANQSPAGACTVRKRSVARAAA